MFNQNRSFSSFPNYYNNIPNPNPQTMNPQSYSNFFPKTTNYNPNYNPSYMPNIKQNFNPSSNPSGNPTVKKPGFNWNGLLNNAQKTLNVVNQAIPVYNQVKPLWGNAKTMLKVFGEISKVGGPATAAATTAATGSATAGSAAAGSVAKAASLPNFFV